MLSRWMATPFLESDMMNCIVDDEDVARFGYVRPRVEESPQLELLSRHNDPESLR